MSDEKKALSASWEAIIEIGKVFSVLSTIILAAGIIVVNSHLSTYGITDFNIVVSYSIAAVLWALLPVWFGWFIAYLIQVGVINNIKEEWAKKRSIFVRIFFVVIFIFPSIYACLFLISWIDERLEPLIGSNFGWLLFYFGIAGFIVSLLVRFIIWLIVKHKEYYLAYLFGFPVFVFILVYLFFFGRYFYGSIPSRFFGGQPDLVQLIVEEDYREEMLALEIKIESSNGITEPIYLIYENNNAFFVATDECGSAAVQIKRNTISSIQYGISQ